MTRLLAWMSLMIMMFTLLLAAIQFVGESVKSSVIEITEQFQCLPAGACWHGIHLGVSTVSEAIAALKNDKTIALMDSTQSYICWRWQNQWHGGPSTRWDGCYNAIPNSDYELTLSYAHSPLRLGDVIPVLGRPISSALCTDIHKGFIDSHNVQISVDVPSNGDTVEPYLVVSGITYFYSEGDPSRRFPDTSEFRWFFFSPWERTGICAG